MFFIFNLNSSIISSSSKTFWLIFRSEEHTSELQSQSNLVCRLLLEKKKKYLFSIMDHQHFPPIIVDPQLDLDNEVTVVPAQRFPTMWLAGVARESSTSRKHDRLALA